MHLSLLGISATEYRSDNVFVLGTTVMNPGYGEAQTAGFEYLGMAEEPPSG